MLSYKHTVISVVIARIVTTKQIGVVTTSIVITNCLLYMRMLYKMMKASKITSNPVMLVEQQIRGFRMLVEKQMCKARMNASKIT